MDTPPLNSLSAKTAQFGKVLAAVGRVDFLSGLQDASLLDLINGSPIRKYEPGELVVQQGNYGHSLFILLQGELEVVGCSEADDVVVRHALSSAGDYFGEGALLGRRRRTASVRTITRAQVLEVEKTRIERLNMATDGLVFEVLSHHSEKRAILRFIRSHRFFKDVPIRQLEALSEGAEMRVFERGEALFKKGDALDRPLLVKAGIAKLQRRNETDVSVQAYFNVGDIVGSRRGTQASELISMGFVEVIALERRAFDAFARNHPKIVEQFRKDDVEYDVGDTVMGFVADFLSEGAQEGLSLLTINLDSCVRCGNCVRACESRHGHARFTRRGHTLVRRKQMDTAGVHETLLIPSSCRHCVNPECMVGCPTGAIHRLPGGEVNIEPFCIGCGSCASRCPYDNITMVPTPGRLVDGFQRDMLANKCNLCAGYDDGPNCVQNCPTGAILRIEPTAYFEELAQVLGRTGQAAVGKTSTSKAKAYGAYIALAIFTLAASVVLGLSVWDSEIYTPWSFRGMAFGGASMLAMLGAVSLGVRRRAANSKRQWGRLRIWTQAHIYLGLFFFVALMAHCQGKASTMVTAMLLGLSALEVVTGVVGVLLYRWIPGTITRIEGDSQVEEDVEEELCSHDEALTRLEASTELDFMAASKVLKSELPGYGRLFSKKYAHDETKKELQKSLGSFIVKGGLSAAAVSKKMVEHSLRQRELRGCLWIYRMRRGWLVSHLAITAALVALTLFHVGSVFFFWSGLAP